MTIKKRVIRHISLEELEHLIRNENDKNLYQRLLFIYNLYELDDVEKACKRVCISNQTGYTWLERWNANRYYGLIPQFRGGRPRKLNNKDKSKLKKLLESKGLWLTFEVKALIRKEFGVSYSFRQVARILREFDMNYSKPYPKDYRRPDNADDILKERLDKAINEVGKGKDYILGFMDEASPQTTDNKQRFWSFGKAKITKNTTKYRANTFGFYAVNGNDVVDFKENSKLGSIFEFLQTIRSKNKDNQIIIVLDNFKSHISQKTRKYAESLGIILVFLPPYSPNLNPIEQIWRCVRRKISQIFIKSQWAFTETIKTTYCRLTKKQSFMSKWLTDFLPDLKLV